MPGKMRRPLSDVPIGQHPFDDDPTALYHLHHPEPYRPEPGDETIQKVQRHWDQQQEEAPQ